MQRGNAESRLIVRVHAYIRTYVRTYALRILIKCITIDSTDCFQTFVPDFHVFRAPATILDFTFQPRNVEVKRDRFGILLSNGCAPHVHVNKTINLNRTGEWTTQRWRVTCSRLANIVRKWKTDEDGYVNSISRRNVFLSRASRMRVRMRKRKKKELYLSISSLTRERNARPFIHLIFYHRYVV